MRARKSASQACGSMPFILAVMIRLYMAAARRPPRSEPQNNQDFRPLVRRHCWTDIPAYQRNAHPALQDIVERLGEVMPTGEFGELFSHVDLKIVDRGPARRLRT